MLSVVTHWNRLPQLPRVSVLNIQQFFIVPTICWTNITIPIWFVTLVKAFDLRRHAALKQRWISVYLTLLQRCASSELYNTTLHCAVKCHSSTMLYYTTPLHDTTSQHGWYCFVCNIMASSFLWLIRVARKLVLCLENNMTQTREAWWASLLFSDRIGSSLKLLHICRFMYIHFSEGHIRLQNWLYLALAGRAFPKTSFLAMRPTWTL